MPKWRAGVMLPLALLLAVRLALGLTYAFTVPIWESYDEDGHFAYARYLAKYHTLLRPGDPEAANVWEKFQPPLYYALVAPAIAGFDLGERFLAPERNPYFGNGNAGANYALHPEHQEATELQIALAVRVARCMSVLMSTASVIFVYLAARQVWPGEPSTAWAATCLYAFWPQFLFVGSMVTNDALATSLSAVVVCLSIKLAQDGFRLRTTLLMVVSLGCALLAKLTTLALIPLAAAAFLMSLAPRPGRGGHRTSLRIWLALGSGGALIALVLWMLSSLEFVTAQAFQFGTVTRFFENVPGLSRTPEENFVAAALRYGFRTFLASFGWGNLEAYTWLYSVWAVSAGVALAGLILAGARRLYHRPGRAQTSAVNHPGTQSHQAPVKLLSLMAIHAASLTALSLGLAISYQSIYLVPGRYLLPALPAVSFLLVAGWRAWMPERLRVPAWQAISLGILLVGWSIPFAVLAPAYAKPGPISNLSSVVTFPSSLFFADSIQALGYIPPGAATPGRDLNLSLCWQTSAPLSQDYAVLLEVVGPDGQGYGRLESYPGRGNYPTSEWRPKTPFCDRYSINVGKAVPAPSLAGVRVFMLDGAGGDRLPLTDSAGVPQPDQSIWIPIRVRASGPVPALAHQVRYRFADGIILSGYDVGPLPEDPLQIRVTLRWEALVDLTRSDVVFVHLRDPNAPQTRYVQDDQPPRRGWYPTSAWQPGEIVLDEHLLSVPAALANTPLDLYVGLYDADTHIRLPAFDAQGRPVPNGEIILEKGLVFSTGE